MDRESAVRRTEIYFRDLLGELNNAAEVRRRMGGVVTLIVPDDMCGPGIIRGHASFAAMADRIVTESGRVLKDKNAAF